MQEVLIPSISQKQARERFSEQVEAWRNFAQRITKNPFVKEHLLRRDGNKCAWCNGTLGETVQVHHISYNHACTFQTTIWIDRPTEKRPARTALIPDCKSCKQQDEGRFQHCMNKLVLVHGICNKNISRALTINTH